MLKNSLDCHCEQSEAILSKIKIKHYPIAVSLKLLAITAKIEFFRKLLEKSFAVLRTLFLYHGRALNSSSLARQEA
jgi:hypothetical protein